MNKEKPWKCLREKHNGFSVVAHRLEFSERKTNLNRTSEDRRIIQWKKYIFRDKNAPQTIGNFKTKNTIEKILCFEFVSLNNQYRKTINSKYVLHILSEILLNNDFTYSSNPSNWSHSNHLHPYHHHYHYIITTTYVKFLTSSYTTPLK